MQGKEPQLRVVQNTSGREGGSCLNPEDCKRPFQVACCCTPKNKPQNSSVHICAVNKLSFLSATVAVLCKGHVIFDEHEVLGPAVHGSRRIHNLLKSLGKSTVNLLTLAVKHFSVEIKL